MDAVDSAALLGAIGAPLISGNYKDVDTLLFYGSMGALSGLTIQYSVGSQIGGWMVSGVLGAFLGLSLPTLLIKFGFNVPEI